MTNKTTLTGTVNLQYSQNKTNCVCCPDGRHVYCRSIIDDMNEPINIGSDALKAIATRDNDGKKVQITIEVIED